MNASLPNLNPANAVQSPSSAGKPQDGTTPEVPFSQVLSSEIAQKNRGNDAQGGTKSLADSENPSAPADATGDLTSVAPKLASSTTEPDGPTLELQSTDHSPAVPETAFLGLALPPDRLKLTQADPGESQSDQSDQAVSLENRTSSTLDDRKGRSQQAIQTKQLDDHMVATEKSQAAQSDKLASTAAFSGQLAAARQSDARKTGELLTDIISHPGIRATPPASLDPAPALETASANKLAPSVGTTAWGQALGEKIVWMAAGAQQTASLTLNPPNLGPLQIVLNISNEQATASFFSAQPEVRQALEAAFPKLKEMMNEAGIQLGQATVSSDTPQHHEAADRQAQRNVTSFSGFDENTAAGLPATHTPVPRSGRGLIDTFA